MINPVLKLLKFYITPYQLNWSAAAAVAGSYLQSKSAKKAAAAQQAAAAQAAQGAEFDPYNVQGAFGQSFYREGEEGKVITPAVIDPTTGRVITPEVRSQGREAVAGTQLDPRYQQLQDLFGQQAGAFAQQGQTALGQRAGELGQGFLQNVQTDPFAGAQSQFEKMEAILNPSRERSRDALESRLLRQGRLGSSGGSLQQQGLESSIEESRQRGLFDALQQSQSLQQSQVGLGTQLGLFGQQQQDVGFNQAQARLGAVQGLDQQGLEYLRLGGALGGREAAAGANQGAFYRQGAAAGSAAQLGAARGYAGALGQIGSALSNYNFGGSNNYSGFGGVNRGSQQDTQLAQQNEGFY